MVEYNASIDSQISEALRLRGQATLRSLAGIDEQEAASLLARYAEVHASEQAFVFDGTRLTWASQAGASPSESVPPMSPVDQVLSAPPGKSLLDTARAEEPVAKAMWLLPLSLGLVGGVLAFFLVRGRSPRAARSLLIVGVVVQLLSWCVMLLMPKGFRLPGVTSTTSSSSQSNAPVGAVTWPASGSDMPVFYYFGTST